MRITIVTPTLNRAPLLAEALASLGAQDWPDLQHIVVDGGSTDGTAEMLARDFPHSILLHDRGKGLYDAINLGIENADGDVVGFLNSDDLLPEGALAAVAAGFDDARVQSVCGVAELFDASGTVATWRDPSQPFLDPFTVLIGSSIINARFFRQTALARLEGFPVHYRYVADRALLANAYVAGLHTKAIQAVVYRYRQHDGSLTLSGTRQNDVALRRELLELAQFILRTSTDRRMRRAARLLKGRCVAVLTARTARQGQIGEAIRLLATEERAPSLAPLGAILATLPDWLARRGR